MKNYVFLLTYLIGHNNPINGFRPVYSLQLNFLKNPNKETDFDKDLDTTLINKNPNERH